MHDIVRILMPVGIIGAGLFSIVCSVKEYPFFWQNRRARTIVLILGNSGAKVFYVTLGIALVAIGLGIATGYVPADAGSWIDAGTGSAPDAP
jgi:hypothetical protein